MTIQEIASVRVTFEVLSIDILRLKTGPDRVYLRTNAKSPCYPYHDSLILEYFVTRGQGPDHCRRLYPSVETHVIDNTLPMGARRQRKG